MQGREGSQVSQRRGLLNKDPRDSVPLCFLRITALGRPASGGHRAENGKWKMGSLGREGGRDSGGCQQSHSLVGHPPFLSQCHRPIPPTHWSMRASHCPLLPQLVEKRLAALNTEEGVQAPPRLCAARSGPSPEQETGPGKGLGVSDKARPADADGQDLQRHGRARTHLSGPRAFALSPGRRESPAPRAGRVPSPPQGQRCSSSQPGPRDAPVLREAPPARDTRGPVDGSSEDEEELPSLAFLLASQHSLLPWGLSQSPAPASVIPSPGGRGPWGAPRAPSPQRIGLGPAIPPATKSRKRALCEGPASVAKTPLPGANLRVSGRPALPVGLVHPSQPAKRRGDSLVTGSRRKRHCSQ